MIIKVSKKEEIVIFRLKGRFITPNNRQVLEVVEQTICGRIPHPKLVFDFKEVTLIDCAGLGTLMKISTDILRRGGRLAVVNMNEHIKKITVMTHLSSVFDCFNCENDAVTMLSERS